MKIAILVRHFPPTEFVGGVAVATKNFVDALSGLDSQNEIHVITSTSSDCLMELPHSDNIIIHRVLIKKNRGIVAGMYYQLKAYLLIKKIAPDIVHVQGIEHAFPAYVFHKTYETPYCVWGQGSDVHLKWHGKKIFGSLFTRHASRVFVLSKKMQQDVTEYWGVDSIIIPNGFTPLPRSERDDVPFHLRPTLITVGRLDKIKGINYALEAIKQIKETYPNILYLLVGDGPERLHLESYVSDNGLRDNVTFMGMVENNLVPRYLNKADIYLQPSLSEGFSISIIEAMSYGLPLIVTSVGAAPDIITPDINGYLVSPENVDEIVVSVCDLLTLPKLRQSMRTYNHEKSKDYSWEKIACTILSEYNWAIL